LIDTDNAVILDVEPTRSIRQAEVGAVRTMIDRVRKTHDLKPERLIADTAYGSGAMLDWLVEKRGIAPHIPVIDKSGRTDGTFERADFTYDTENDLYICPDGKELKQYAYSGVIRPVIPKVSGHPFRFYPATDSGASGHPVM